MFEIAADVRPVQAEGVVAVGAADVVRSGEGFTEVAADEVFVTYLRTEGCPSCCPVEIAVQVDAVDVGMIVVILHLVWLSTIPLIAIQVLVPVDAGGKAQPSMLGLCLNGSEKFGGVFVLVVGLPFGRGVEGAGTPAFVGDAQMPVQLYRLVFVLSLVEGFAAAEVSVQRTACRSAVTIAATVSGTYLIVPLPLFQVASAADPAIAV